MSGDWWLCLIPVAGVVAQLVWTVRKEKERGASWTQGS